MSCGEIPTTDRLARYCGETKHDKGRPQDVVFQARSHISANWIEYFGTNLAVSLEKIRKTCGLQLGPLGAFPIASVENIHLAIRQASAIPDVRHNEEGPNVSHAEINWSPRTTPVDRMVALKLSELNWDPRPRAREGIDTPQEWV